MSWGWEWKITGSEFGVWTIILFLPLSWTRHLALLGPCSLWNKGLCSAQLSRVLKRQHHAGGTGGGGGGCVVGGVWRHPALRAGLALPYRLGLTLTPRCGPRACPPASPPFLVENRKLWLFSASWGGQGRAHHPPTHPSPALVDLP